MKAPEIKQEQYQAGLQDFNDGLTVIALFNAIQTEKDHEKSTSYAIGFIEGLVKAIRAGSVKNG